MPRQVLHIRLTQAIFQQWFPLITTGQSLKISPHPDRPGPPHRALSVSTLICQTALAPYSASVALQAAHALLIVLADAVVSSPDSITNQSGDNRGMSDSPGTAASAGPSSTPLLWDLQTHYHLQYRPSHLHEVPHPIPSPLLRYDERRYCRLPR